MNLEVADELRAEFQAVGYILNRKAHELPGLAEHAARGCIALA